MIATLTVMSSWVRLGSFPLVGISLWFPSNVFHPNTSHLPSHLSSYLPSPVRVAVTPTKVSSTNMAPLYQRAIVLANKFEEFNLEHIRREHNGRADTLANMAMDSRWSGSRKGRIVSPETNLLGAGAGARVGAGAVDA